MAIDVHMIELSDGAEMPAIGSGAPGTWGRGAPPATRRPRRSARGVEAGVMLVDTAEMYGDGEAERLVGEALLGTAGSRRPRAARGPHYSLQGLPVERRARPHLRRL